MALPEGVVGGLGMPFYQKLGEIPRKHHIWFHRNGAAPTYKNGGADEIIFIFKGGGTLETVFGKQRYRAEDYIVVPRGITYRLVPDKIEEEDYLILESSGPVRIPKRYLNGE